MEEMTVPMRLGKRAKVTPEIVRAIRKEYAQGFTQMALADKYGIKQPNVSKIIRRIAWAFVEDEPLDQ